jgi:hypothetical protein
MPQEFSKAETTFRRISPPPCSTITEGIVGYISAYAELWLHIPEDWALTVTAVITWISSMALCKCWISVDSGNNWQTEISSVCNCNTTDTFRPDITVAVLHTCYVNCVANRSRSCFSYRPLTQKKNSNLAFVICFNTKEKTLYFRYNRKHVT